MLFIIKMKGVLMDKTEAYNKVLEEFKKIARSSDSGNALVLNEFNTVPETLARIACDAIYKK
jgi:mitochondrial fission protein ELM1